MLEKIKERIGNVFELATSKKFIVTLGTAALLIHVTSVEKIIAIGCVSCAYILAQGWVDSKKVQK